MSEVEIVSAVKRARKPNFSPAECTTILCMAEENLSIIRDKFSNTITNKRKAEVWENITDSINAHGVAKRSVREVKDKWRSIVMGAKREFDAEKQARKKTGGGKEPIPVTSTAEKIISIFGDEPSFSGIHGGIESGVDVGTFDGVDEGIVVIIWVVINNYNFKLLTSMW